MNGVITRITNGSAGTRFARITPLSVPARPILYMTVAIGMPYVTGGTIKGNRKISIAMRLPRNCTRASAYAAGTPSRTERITTAPTTSTVTHNTLANWKSLHACAYQCSVKPCGNSVPNQRVATELTATVAISNTTLTRKNTTAPHTSTFHTRSGSGVRCLTALPG